MRSKSKPLVLVCAKPITRRLPGHHRCPKCRRRFSCVVSTRRKPYVDPVIGVPNVHVVGHVRWCCPSHPKEGLLGYTALGQALAALAIGLARIRDRRLHPKEVRYLQKYVLGHVVAPALWRVL